MSPNRNQERIKIAVVKTVRLVKTANITFIAIVCFVCGTVYMFKSLKPFHELGYDKAHLLDSMLSGYADRSSIARSGLPNGVNLTTYADTVQAEIAYRRYLAEHLPDSAIDAVLIKNQLLVNDDSFDLADMRHFASGERIEDKRTAPLTWDYFISYSLLYNRPLAPYHIQKSLSLGAVHYTENTDFFSKYPGMALWVLITIIEFTLFPVLIVIAIGAINGFYKNLPDSYKTENHVVPSVLWTIAIIVAFIFVGKRTFYDLNVITDIFFYRDMGDLITILFFIGYALAGVCFSGYLIIARLPANAPGTNNSTDEASAAMSVEIIQKVNELFNTLLTISSIGLSIIVLATGVLYSSINNLEIVQKITADIGYSPVSPSYVSLFSLLNTFLLLLFFIPARISLINLKKYGPKMSPDGVAEKSPAPDFLKGLGDIAMIGSPVFTGVLHFLFSLLAN